MDRNARVLVARVLEWLELEINDAAEIAMGRWLVNNIVQWPEIVRNTAIRGIQWGLAQLDQLRDHIIQRYNNIDGGALTTLSKCIGKALCKGLILVVETSTRPAIRVASKQAIGFFSKAVGRETGAMVVKQAITGVVATGGKQAAQLATKQLVKQVATTGVKQAAVQTVKEAIKMGANPIGITADFAQAVLELAGYNMEGKIVGAIGNVASSAMAGFTIGGPAGAVVGAAAGLAFWKVGELLFYR